MKKEELIRKLESIEENFYLTVAAISLFQQKECVEMLKNESFTMNFTDNGIDAGSASFSLDNAYNLLINHGESCLIELLKLSLRPMLSASYEDVKDYCERTNQLRVFEKVSWYHFLRIFRNCVNHNYFFEFNKKDKKILPVKWRKIEINHSMHGEKLGFKLLNPLDTYYLLHDIVTFVKNELN